ncbi:MAG: WG repeat-containing protein [Oscillospiraceae bacterium]|nr:WG repeat-containing protein [Oscillospiraceae bacterium]
MKKLIIIICATVLTLTLFACDKSGQSEQSGQSGQSTVAASQSAGVTIAKTSEVTTSVSSESATVTESTDDRVPLGNEFYSEVVPPKYDWIKNFSEGLAVVQVKNKQGVINKSNEEVVPPKYNWIENFSEGLAVVFDGSKFGVINEFGEEVLPLEYANFSSYFSEGVAWAKKTHDSDYGLIDKNGNEILPYKYHFAKPFVNGIALVYTKDGDDYSSHFIDKTGKVFLSIPNYCDRWYYSFPDYCDSWDYSNPLYLISIDEIDDYYSRYGYVDKEGKQIIPYSDPIAPTIFQDSGLNLSFSDGLAPYKKDGKFIAIDESGNQAFSQSYDILEGFSEGLSAFRRDGISGFVDTSGKEVITIDEDGYVYTGKFSEGLAPVVIRDKLGYIDKNGDTVIPFIYDPVDDGHTYWIFSDFTEGLAIVAKGDMQTGYKYGIVDKSGKEVVPLVYDYLLDLSDGMAVYSVGRKWGILSVNNE